MLVAISLAFITGCGVSSDSGQGALVPKIIRGGPVADGHGEVALAGQVIVYNELAEQIKVNRSKDALFVVKVVCSIPDVFEEKEKYHNAYIDALNVPIVQEYKAQYDEWSRTPTEKLDAYSAQFRDDGKPMSDSFYAYWVSTHTEEEKAAYDAAWALVEEKYDAFFNMYEYMPRAHTERTFEEANRLQDKGLMLVWKDYSEMEGLLTGEQIMNFPANEKYGYYITWAETPETGELTTDE